MYIDSVGRRRGGRQLRQVPSQGRESLSREKSRRLERFYDRELEEEEVSEDLINEYLCNQTDMYFYTNPLEIPGTDGAGGTILDMKCEVFTLWDDLQQKN